jgi:dTDP-4-dehydrorhamnose reductase
MRILVIRATGLLGTETARLLSRDHKVVGASRKGPALTVDISDKASMVADPDEGVPAAVVAQAFRKRGGRHHRPSNVGRALSSQLRKLVR